MAHWSEDDSLFQQPAGHWSENDDLFKSSPGHWSEDDSLFDENTRAHSPQDEVQRERFAKRFGEDNPALKGPKPDYQTSRPFQGTVTQSPESFTRLESRRDELRGLVDEGKAPESAYAHPLLGHLDDDQFGTYKQRVSQLADVADVLPKGVAENPILVGMDDDAWGEYLGRLKTRKRLLGNEIEFQKSVRDDFQNMRDWTFGRIQQYAGIGQEAAAGYAQMLADVPDNMNPALDRLARNWFEKSQANMRMAGFSRPESLLARMGTDALDSMPYLASGVFASMASKTPYAGELAMAALVGPGEYAKARLEKGLEPLDALQESSLRTLAEVVPERIAGIFQRTANGVRGLRGLAQQTLGEAGSEMLTELSHIGIDASQTGEVPGLVEGAKRVAYAGGVGALMGGPASLPALRRGDPRQEPTVSPVTLLDDFSPSGGMSEAFDTGFKAVDDALGQERAEVGQLGAELESLFGQDAPISLLSDVARPVEPATQGLDVAGQAVGLPGVQLQHPAPVTTGQPTQGQEAPQAPRETSSPVEAMGRAQLPQVKNEQGEWIAADPRLMRQEYRGALLNMTKDLIKGGGMGLVQQGGPRRADGSLKHDYEDTTHTPSENPGWFQVISDITGTSTDRVKRAVQAALNGRKLGVRQEEVVNFMLDTAQGERTGMHPVYGPEFDSWRDMLGHFRAQRAEEKSAAAKAEFGNLDGWVPELADEASEFYAQEYEGYANDLATETERTDQREGEAGLPERQVPEYAAQAEASEAEAGQPEGRVPDQAPVAPVEPAEGQQATPIQEKAETPAAATADAAVPEIQAETAPEQVQPQETEPEGKIEDFGEKIGGARKDTAEPTGTRGKAVSDERPGWMRRYAVQEVLADSVNGQETRGKFAVHDTRLGRDLRKGYSTRYFDTREEAEAAIPLAEVSRNHRVTAEGRGDEQTWAIRRAVSDRKRPIIKDGFSSREEAMRYMAENAVEIIETKTRLDPSIHPALTEALRKGDERREGDRNVAARDFADTFGFRGVEFGKWNNSRERQHILNQAYDALLDMADMLKIPPRAISLNGELGLGFGSRGHGLSGAQAHYERDYAAINLTKISGAGSLAHEWLHAFDHYLGRQAGKAESERVENERGDKVFPASSAAGRDYVSHGFGFKAKERTREELREAFDQVMDAITRREIEFTEDLSTRERVESAQQADLERKLDAFRAEMAKDYSNESYKRYRGEKNNKPAPAKKLAEVDRIIAEIKAGNEGEVKSVAPKSKSRMAIPYSFNEKVIRLSEIMKEHRGRQGYSRQQGHLAGPIADIHFAITNRNRAAEFLAEAKAEKVKSKKVRTEFYSEAWKMDQGQKADYWSTPHEMAARAFESYIYDRLKGIEARNDFLAYEKRNDLPVYRMLKVKPYPEGTERETINEAWDGFFDVLQSRETEQGVELYSQGAEAQDGPGLSVERIQVIVDEHKATRASKFKVVESRAEVPESGNLEPLSTVFKGELEAFRKRREWLLRNQPESERKERKDEKRGEVITDVPFGKQRKSVAGGVEGLYDPDGDTIYLFADQFRDEDRVRWVSWHELWHRGARVAYGDALDSALGEARSNPVVRRLANAIYRDRDMAADVADGRLTEDRAQMIAAEEALAELDAARLTGDFEHIRERYKVRVPGGLKSGWRKVVADFFDALRRVLGRVLGRDASGMTDQQVREVIMRGSEASGGNLEARQGAAMASEAQGGLLNEPTSQEQLKDRKRRIDERLTGKDRELVDVDEGPGGLFGEDPTTKGQQPLFMRAPRTPVRADEGPGLGGAMKNWWDREFRAKGNLPDTVFAAKIVTDNMKGADELHARHLLKDFDRAVKSGYGKSFFRLSDEQQEQLNAYLAGEDVEVPESVREALGPMRAYLDHLSTLMISTGVVDGAVAETVAGNLGQYLTRSYRAFDDPSWPRKVPEDVRQAAFDYLRNRARESGEFEGLNEVELADRINGIINNILDEGTAADHMAAFITQGKLGAKDLSMLIRRKQIAKQIRDLLGEYHDPRVNFVRSATKMQHAIANHVLLTKVREHGLNNFLFTEPRGRYSVRLAPENSKPLSPLNGLYTTPEIKQAFVDALDPKAMSDWVRHLLMLNGLVKYGKTVLSITTMMRNFTSASIFSMANGHIFTPTVFHDLKAASSTLWGELRTKRDQRAYSIKLKKLGVTLDNPYPGEMIAAMNDAINTDIVGGTARRSARKVFGFFTTLYQYGDDFWKIMGFESEKAALIKAGLPENQAEKLAAQRIRNTYPTYSLVGRTIKRLRRFPLVGTFVSFSAEIIRTAPNIMRTMAEDAKAGRHGMVARRVVGMAVAAGWAAALTALTKAMVGLDDDDDDAVRKMAAPWTRNSNLAYAGYNDDGHLEYFDLSYLDPYNYLKRPINALLTGGDWKENMLSIRGGGGLRDLLDPFLGPDIAAQALGEVVFNSRLEGGEVYNPDAPPDRIMLQIGNHLRKALQPGTALNLERMFKATREDVSRSGTEYTWENELWALAGFRRTTMNPAQGIRFRAYDFARSKRNATSLLSRPLGGQNKTSDNEIRQAFREMMYSRDQAYADMMETVALSRKLGMEDEDIFSVLDASGLSKEDAYSMLEGEVPEWRPSSQFLESARETARLTAPERRRDEINEQFDQRVDLVDELVLEYYEP